MYIAAAIQIISTANIEHNLERIAFWVKEAADQGATIAVLPENFAYLGGSDARGVGLREESDQAIQSFMSQLAQENGIALIGGTIPRANDRHGGQHGSKVYAACHSYDETGKLIGRYDKIHLFDATVADNQSNYCESCQYAPGREFGMLDWQEQKIGVAVCYDLRFPEYFRHLADEGASILAVPAAFTEVTGEAHWHVLLRARAIENQMFVIAANQGGVHDAKRATYGHSCIIDPWGRILDEIPTGEGLAIATIDPAIRVKLQASMPVLNHRVLWKRN